MMKKLLVIKPPFRSFPMGFAYVLSCLERNSIPFDFIDGSFYGNIGRYIKKNDYMAVATGGLVGQFAFFREVACQSRAVNRDLPIILGGNITKDIRDDFMFDKLGVDYGIVGEAETSLPHLCDGISTGSNDFRNIPGLIFRDGPGGKIVRNAPRRLDLKKHNILPAWHCFNMDYYSRDAYLLVARRSAMPLLSGRGCVGQCSFCSPTLGSFRMRPIKHVIEEIQFLNSNYDFEWFVFFNEMFYPSKKMILEFCRIYQGLSPKKPWLCALRADADVDTETFIAMKEAGCVNTGVGIESGSDKVLRLMKKSTTAEMISRFFRSARKAELPSHGTFMVGNEGEAEEDVRQTIDMAIKEGMDTGESLTCAYPGTLIYKNALERGQIVNEWEYLQNLRFGAGVWETGWKNRDYLNISEIPNDRFWGVITKELRRYHTFSLNKFGIKDVEYKPIFGMNHIEMSGFCSRCGNRVVLYYDHQLLGLEGYCPKCTTRAIFNIYDSKDLAGHYNYLRKELEGTKKLVVVGTDSNAAGFIRVDYFGLDYDRLVGFLEIKQSGQGTRCDTFIHKPRFGTEDLFKVKPDGILIADDPMGDAEILLKIIYSERGLWPPRIMHVIPDKRRWGEGIVRLMDRLKSGKDTGKMYRLFLSSMLRITRIRARIMDLLYLPYRLLFRIGPRRIATRLIPTIRYFLRS